MEYTTHEIDPNNRFRVVPHDCGRETCNSCKEGMYVWLFNSDHYDPHRWVITGLLDSEFTSPFDEILENEAHRERFLAAYGRLSAIFGSQWDTIERDWHFFFDRCTEFMNTFGSQFGVMEQIEKIDAKYIKFFRCPEEEKASLSVDRVKTLLAFPELYKPNKKKKGKKK